MKKYLTGVWYSLPVQLFFLHFRRYQLLLVFWFMLFATIGGVLMQPYGADSLFLAPEYFNNVNALSTAIVGMAIGIFIMSWNITTFILHNRHIKFLATTAQPFLKYCINNSIIPLCFLFFYFFAAIEYDAHKELKSTIEIAWLVGGFLGGLIIAISLAFLYFFGADKTIYRRMATVITAANKEYDVASKKNLLPVDKHEVRVDWFLSARLKLRKPRDVKHYSQQFLDSIFKRHHIAAVLSIFFAFISLIAVGFISDQKLFQIPAAASVTIFFAVLVAVVGACSLFMKNWSMVFLILLYVVLNILYQKNILDLRNKAYGLNYQNTTERPQYTQANILALANEDSIRADEQLFLQRLNNWKANQQEEKPVLYIINTSGGGIRSAAFTFNVMQHLDSMMHGDLMRKTLFISGASGGMLGAAYFRELYASKMHGTSINLQDKQYAEDISKDLLNPLFSSFVTRDIIGPVQKFKNGGFTYTKDRGYAFEQKLNENTHGLLDKSMNACKQDEASGKIPTMFFSSVISRDGRKMIFCTQPVRFLMMPLADTGKSTRFFEPDAVDFNSFFAKQSAGNVSLLSALRMNATFPYVLPNVWMPTEPVIDVMDAGLRDNFGQENSLRFIQVFKKWLQENTSKVVLIQIRDRSADDWQKPYEGKDLVSMVTRPVFLLQYNWFKLQDYYQHDEYQYMYGQYGDAMQRIVFQYLPIKGDANASLSFHLVAREKKEVYEALQNPTNIEAFKAVSSTMQH
jgi:hypothetical protein